MGDSWPWGCWEGRAGSQDNFWHPPVPGIPMLAKVSMHRWPEAFLPLEMRAGTLTCSCGHPVRTSESGLRNPQRVLRQGRDRPNQGMQPRKPGRQRGAPSITSWTQSWLLGTRGSPEGRPESAVQVSAGPGSGVSGGAAGELPGAQSREYLHTQRRRVKGRSVNSQFQGRWRKAH